VSAGLLLDERGSDCKIKAVNPPFRSMSIPREINDLLT
jgi:hypothetical protein